MLVIGGERREEGFMTMRSRLALITLLGLILGCNNPDFQSNIPSVPVNIEVDLSSIDNIDLQQIGNHKYFNGGVRGIVLIRISTTEFVALDRNCTFEPSTSTAVVSMHDSGFYLEDTTCVSTFDHAGFPTGGPADFPLKKYNITRSGDLLFIVN